MGVDDPILGDLPQPEMEWHDRILQVLLQPPVGFNKNILDHVTHTHPWLDTAIQPHPDQAEDGILVPFNQLVDRLGVPLTGLVQQLFGFFRLGPHRCIILQPNLRFQ